MEGICKLHNKSEDLKLSHIIPKFAFDYFKSTGSKFMRGIENPNKRHQDGPKDYLLCNDAEQLFSKRERWFANNIFFPYLKDSKKQFEYDENLAYFSISVLWRVLINQMEHDSIKSDDRLLFLSDVEKEWREFLLNFKYPINYDNLNLFLTDRIESHNTQFYNVDLYFTRIIDATIIHNEDFSKIAVYAKFLRFTFWSIVKGNFSDNEDINIKFSKGIIKTPQNIEDDFITGFFNHRINLIDNKKSLDESQVKKIQDEMKKVENEFWESDAGKSMMNDYNNASS